jgi:phosphoserine phosphatase
LSGLRPGIISDLCRPLATGEADFVKARFGRGGGRVTELTAKPMLKVFFPELAHVAQPLGGIIAARCALLRSLQFESAYGVDIGLLIDASRAGARVQEVDIGSLEHDSQPLQDLTAMANEVSRVIYSRAREAGRLHVDQIVAMYESQRQATASLEYILSRRRDRRRLVLLDMDGTITPSRFALELGKATGQEAALRQLLDGKAGDAATRSRDIAGLFRFVPRRQFERVAQGLEIRPGVVEWVRQMRRRGYMVGLVSDSYFVAAEVMRRRIFADFALAHVMQFESEVCTGELRLNPAFFAPNGAPEDMGKGHVLQRLRADGTQALFTEVWAVGDHLNDVPMLSQADQAYVIDPKSAALLNVPGVQCITSFEELILRLPPEPAPVPAPIQAPLAAAA